MTGSDHGQMDLANRPTPGSDPVDVADPIGFPWESVIGERHDIAVVDARPLDGHALHDEVVPLMREVIDPFDILVMTAGSPTAMRAAADPSLSVVLVDGDADFATVAADARRMAADSGGIGLVGLGRLLLPHLESYFETIDVPRTLRPDGRWIGLPGPAWSGPVVWAPAPDPSSGGSTSPDGLHILSRAWGRGPGSGVAASLGDVAPGSLSAVMCTDTSLTSKPGDLAAWLPEAHRAARTTGVLGVVIDVDGGEGDFDSVSTEVLDATLGRVSLDGLTVLAESTAGVATTAVMMLRKIG